MSQTDDDQTAPSRPGPAHTESPDPTPFPTAQERLRRLQASGIPERYFDVMGGHGMSPLNQKMGIETLEMSVDRLVARMPVAGNEQNYGLLHGGAHFVLAEALGSFGAVLHALENLDRDLPAVGTELNATHHRSARRGWVTAICTPISLGKTLTSHEIVMRDDDGSRLSTARMSNMILWPR